MELAAQINRLLENHLKVKADYCRSEIASKKMLSNISHDIKTPMTVILGYLEIMRINGISTDEMLGKIEQKAENVMELINQFFTLAKLESGDMDICLLYTSILDTLSNDESYGMILRAKGMVEGKDGQWIYFDMVPGEADIREGSADYTGRICVIGSKIQEDKLSELFGI